MIPRKSTPFCVALLLFLILPAGASAQTAPPPKTRNVILIVADGLRWQEVFTGADPLLLHGEDGGSWMGEAEMKKRYWSDDPQERRRRLFPFLWTVAAREGQIFGNRARGSDAHVTNGMAFSYPGYNEMTTGAPDPRIQSNEFGPNPNRTVFEWLNGHEELRGKVAVYGTWSTYKNIFNVARSHLVIQAGWDPPVRAQGPQADATFGFLYRSLTRFDEEDVYNAFLHVALVDYLEAAHPRVVFAGYGETDNWAHQGRYDLVLESAHQFDHFVEDLWKRVQADPVYRGTTTFIITTDHGRGNAPKGWKDHGADQKGSENIWIAVIGPDTAPLGERSNVPAVTQAQIAATVAALLGWDYRREVPGAAPPIEDVLGKK